MSRAACTRTASLRRRRTRLRWIALPVFLVTVKPTRGGPSSPRFRTSSRKTRPRRFSPRRTARNSARLRSRAGEGRPGLPVSGNDPVFRSGRQPLPAAVATGCDDAAAALGGHARAEAVPALADEFGWLIGTLHLF